jgi:hypothetical protein
MKWRVVAQMPTVRMGANNTPSPGYDITVETDTGHRDVVFVPTNAYTVDGVKAAIEERLGKASAIADLAGEMTCRW